MFKGREIHYRDNQSVKRENLDRCAIVLLADRAIPIITR